MTDSRTNFPPKISPCKRYGCTAPHKAAVICDQEVVIHASTKSTGNLVKPCSPKSLPVSPTQPEVKPTSTSPTLPTCVAVQCGGTTRKHRRCMRRKILPIGQAQMGRLCHNHPVPKPALSHGSTATAGVNPTTITSALPAGTFVFCGGTTRANQPCKRNVRLPHPQVQDSWFCYHHGSAKPCLRNLDEFDVHDWIPSHLGKATQIALQKKALDPPTCPNSPGYIYALVLKDPKSPGKLLIKIGREVTRGERVKHWTNHYWSLPVEQIFGNTKVRKWKRLFTLS